MQKALDDLLQIYLERETHSESWVEKKYSVRKLKNDDSPMNRQQEEDFLQALCKCLEEKGIMRELQAFMRQKLVNVLKGVSPNLVNTRCEGNLGRVATTLIEEFMCCHKLLFTFSVLGTELENGLTLGKSDFGKMPSPSVETLLADMGVKRNTTLSHLIISTYSQNENWSLLECILDSAPWTSTAIPILTHKGPKPNGINENEINTQHDVALATIEAKLREINTKYTEKTLKIQNNNKTTVEEKLQELTEAMELDKEAQIEIRMEKFRKEEVAKIRDEIETQLKFQILQKEKELLRNFENQVTHLKRSLRREKQIWNSERIIKEKELSETRKELIKALAVMKTDENANNQEIKDPKDMHELLVADREEQGDPVQDQDAKPKVRRKLLRNTSNVQQSPGKFGSSSILNIVMTKKELEREYLLKEASLRSSIDKLKAENDLLRKSIPEPANQEPPQKLIQNLERLYESRPRPNRENGKTHSEYNNSDTIALLQYQLEAQNEEIGRLRQSIVVPNANILDIKQGGTVTGITTIPKALTTDIDDFLAKSKARFAQIELEARSVESTFNKFHGKKENSHGIPFLVDDVVLPIPDRPKLPPPYPKSLFDDLNSKKFEYFPKYLTPGVVKPPPIKEYKPILGSSVNYISQPQRTTELASTSSEILSIEPTVTRTVAPPLLEDQMNIRARDTTAAQADDSFSRQEYRSNVSSTQLPNKQRIQVPKLSSSEVQISPSIPDAISASEVNVVDARDSHPRETFTSNKKLDSGFSQDVHAPVMPVAKTPETKIQSPPRPVTAGQKQNHQEKANLSGALVRDKVSSHSELEQNPETNDLSLNSTHLSASVVSQKEVPNVHSKPEPGPAPAILSWADILSGAHTSSFESIPVIEKETIDDIGQIETSNIDDDDEDIWNL